MLSTFANPHKFMSVSARILPVMTVAGLIVTLAALAWGLMFAPPERYQGETARILFVHVPAAWLSLAGYSALAVSSLVYLIWKHALADIAARATALPVAAAALICLLTGSLWGRPTWGTYWVWDARLTSMLVQFLLVVGYISLRSAMKESPAQARLAAILALVGFVNLPIIKFSVDWWNTLHQEASVFRLDGPSMSADYLYPLLVAAIGASLLFGALVITVMRARILERRAELILIRLMGEAR